MAEKQPGTNAESEVVAGGFRDRSSALLLVGIVEIVMGIGAWLMVGLVIMGMKFAQANGNPTASVLPSLIVYGGAGAVFIGLGIGSMRRRRWARNLWLVVSAGWTVGGLLGVAGMVYLVPMMVQVMPEPNPSVAVVVRVTLWVTMGFMALLMVLVPAVMFLFYRSASVRKTIEAADPRPSWTDGFPLPVLGAALLFSLVTPLMVSTPWVYGGLFPLFGRFVGGAPGLTLWGVMSLASLAAAIGLWARRVWGWSVAMLLMLFLGTTTVLTYARADIRVLFDAMGMTPAQMELLEKMGMFRPEFLVVPTTASFVVMVVFLLWVRFRIGRVETKPGAGTGPGTGSGADSGSGSGLAVPPPSL